MDPNIADLQAQIVALRMAVEGTWLSLIGGDTKPLEVAERMKAENLAAVAQLPADSPQATVMRDAVHHHTNQLWGSIEWQARQLWGKGG